MRLPEGLAELTGRWLAAYKLLWWAMLAVSLVALTAGQWRSLQSSSQVDRQIFSAGLRPSEVGDQLTFDPLSPAAEAAGIAPDSTLLAVDGQPVPNDLQPPTLARIAREGWLALGPHPDGSAYGKDDRKALEDLAVPLARAIELALERARREAAHEAERRALTDRLAQLEQQLSQVVGLNAPPRPETA